MWGGDAKAVETLEDEFPGFDRDEPFTGETNVIELASWANMVNNGVPFNG